MKKYPAIMWYTGDWRKDIAAHMMSWSSVGIWREILDCMWDALERGRLQGTEAQLARIVGCSLDEFKVALSEIEFYGVASVSRDVVTDPCYRNVTDFGNGVTGRYTKVTIENRRMIREEKERQGNANKQFRYRERKKLAHRNEQSLEKVTPPSSSSSSSSSSKDLKNSCASLPRWHETDFEEIYSYYPKKKGRRKALDSIHLALKRISSRPGFENGKAKVWLIEKTSAFAESARNTERQFIPLPATWYNQDRFDDPLEENDTPFSPEFETLIAANALARAANDDSGHE